MAIYQRDRDFHRLFAEIDVDVIPLKFIKDITCHLNDGTQVILDQDDFKNEGGDGDLEMLIKNLEFYEHLADLKIRINYDLVESEVGSDVARILKDK